MLVATIMGTFLNLLLTYFKPDDSLTWIAGQLIATGASTFHAL